MLKKSLVLMSLLLAVVTMAAEVTVGSVSWETDFRTAQKNAAKAKQPIIMLFTGSDWCGFCIKLEKNVFRTPQFKKLQKKAVLLYLDFPRQKAQSAALKSQNRQLAKKYGVHGYPTTVVIDSNGQVKGQIIGAPGNYLERLTKLLKK